MTKERKGKTGKLFLIGAGPGDPELMTLKGARALEQADVVLYDRLVDIRTLSMARSNASLIDVGKRQGEQERTQAEIFELIKTNALSGKLVARLKGGDPLVFGRGAEEWRLALDFGIDVELIPGVSSAIAVPALAGIPLTFRQISRGFAIVTGHSLDNDPAEWQKYRSIDTLVILMGVRNRQFIAQALIDAGRLAEEPVAFVERGTTPQQKLLTSTLQRVANGEVDVSNPAIFIVGQVVNLQARLR